MFDIIVRLSLDCSSKIHSVCSITYLQTTIIKALNLINCWRQFSCFNFCWAQNQCNFRVSALLIFITMKKVTKLNSILFCFILISNLSIYLFINTFFIIGSTNLIRLSKSSFIFLFIYNFVTSNINIYVNFHSLHLSRQNYCIYTCAHKVVFLSFLHWCRLTLCSINGE